MLVPRRGCILHPNQAGGGLYAACTSRSVAMHFSDFDLSEERGL